MRGLRLGILAVACALAALAVAAPGASAYIYWADFENDQIGRAGNDGSAVEPAFIKLSSGPTAVAVDSSHIYWSDELGKAIGRANLDGSGVAPHFIGTGAQPNDIAVNGTNIYWASGASTSIGRADLDGENVKPNLLSNVLPGGGLAIDSGHIYWANGTGNGLIGRSDLSGGFVDPEFATVPGTTFLHGLAVNTSGIFWGTYLGPDIGRANVLTGEGVDPSFIGSANKACGIAVFGSQIYWANWGDNTIGRANTDSSGVDQDLVTVGGEHSICGVAVDSLAPPPPVIPIGPPPPPDVTPPTATIKTGPGNKLARGKATFSFSSELGAIFECKLDSKKPVRFCRSPKPYSGLKPGKHTFRVWAIDGSGNRSAAPAKRAFRVPAPKR